MSHVNQNERHVERVIIKPAALEVCLIPPCEASDQAEDPIVDEQASCRPQMTTIRLVVDVHLRRASGQ